MEDLGVGLLLLVIGFAFGRVSTRLDRKAAAEDRRRQAEIDGSIGDVDETRAAFEARVDALVSLTEGDAAGLRSTMDAIQEHSGRELLRYYGSPALIRRWWAIADRIERTYVGTDRAQQGPPDAAWIHELRDVRGAVLDAIRKSRSLIALGKRVGEEFVTDESLLAEWETYKERQRGYLQRAVQEDERRRTWTAV